MKHKKLVTFLSFPWEEPGAGVRFRVLILFTNRLIVHWIRSRVLSVISNHLRFYRYSIQFKMKCPSLETKITFSQGILRFTKALYIKVCSITIFFGTRVMRPLFD